MLKRPLFYYAALIANAKHNNNYGKQNDKLYPFHEYILSNFKEKNNNLIKIVVFLFDFNSIIFYKIFLPWRKVHFATVREIDGCFEKCLKHNLSYNFQQNI